MKTPTVPGFYWAKWKIAAKGTHEGDELTPSNDWEVVEVWSNVCDSVEHPEDGPDGTPAFGVHVPGVRETQWPDCFFWGPGPLPEPV
jgi:hypothetical protein